ncbi:serine/threonine-protein kinase [Actinomadura sp. NEAU-AAG7]|uniref:serine/threonine-protein kinase n=1 Tax=Actinomadura sp. NEAU-AAG7 TaxID=2839640 RepID=UPI001BE3F3E8|nr:serine/threonine-protein kinase [Actinomadura sp. NEAU-AAG7]MBT2206524.1 serine/threonine protein kinase [Actinomadura sp. NEAU-AAG7]
MRPLEQGDPRSVGRFRIMACAGSGGMAVVYLGRSAGGRPVAVKMMHAEFVDDPEHRARFHREVAATRAVGGLYGPGLLDADPGGRRPWMATEFVPGVSLRDAVRRFGPLPPDAARALAAGLAEALTLIHRAGYAHLDLKPANVLLTAEGPRVIDFGIAQGSRDGAPVAGCPAGSRGFASPEQEAGAATGPPSDVYSLGATLAFACTGEPPGDPAAVPDEALRAVVAGCLRPDPASRPGLRDLAGSLAPGAPSAWPPPIRDEIHRHITEIENPPAPRAPEPARRRVLLAGAGVLVAALSGGAAGALLLQQNGEPPEKEAREPGSAAPTPLRTASAVPAARSRVLEIRLTGDVRLTSLTYTVGGRSTTLRNVALPWKTAVDIPAYPPSVPWRIRYRHPNGEVDYRVFVDRILNGSGGRGGSTSGGGEGDA